MPDHPERYSDLDANKASEALRRALDIKGTVGSPQRLNVDTLQGTVDILQGGFALYEILNLELSVSATGSGQNITIFDPTLAFSDTDNRQNNRLWEIRILFLEVQLSDLSVADGFTDDDRLLMNLRMEMLGNGPAIDGARSLGVSILKRWKTNLAPDDFIWTIPTQSTQGGGPAASGSDEGIGVNNWQGWIPAGTTFSVRCESPDNNYGGGAQMNVRIQAIRVPKGCRLPV